MAMLCPRQKHPMPARMPVVLGENGNVLCALCLEADLAEARFLARAWQHFPPHSCEVHPFFDNFDREELSRAEDIAAKCEWLQGDDE